MMFHVHAGKNDVPEVLRGHEAALVALRGPSLNMLLFVTSPFLLPPTTTTHTLWPDQF
jgi:hypothetical protein